MQSLGEAIGRELRWQPRGSFSHPYDLVDPQTEGGEPYATLVWRPGLLMCGPAEASSGVGSWRFRRLGLVRGQVLVTAEGSGQPLATLRRHWRRAVLRCEDGREFTWRPESLWGRVRRFEDANGTPVVRLRRALWPPAGAARVEIETSAAGAADRALLACLGWYLSLRERGRHAAGAGA